MNARFDKNSCLEIERIRQGKKTFVPQCCPRSSAVEDHYCGDWCPALVEYNDFIELHCFQGDHIYFITKDER